MSKKDYQSESFLELLSKTPIVSAVCESLDISRQTVYRWCKEDPSFKMEFDLHLGKGRDNINDLAESKLIEKINEGEPWAIRFWLMNNKTNYSFHKSEDFREIIKSEFIKHKKVLKDVDLGDVPCE